MASLSSMITFKRLSVEKRILSLITTIILVLFVIGASVFYRSVQVVAAQKEVSNDTHVIVDLDQVLISLLDMETGQRGFLLTGNPDYLAPYLSGKRVIAKNIANLRLRLQQNSTSPSLLTSLNQHIANKERELKTTILLRKKHGFSSSIRIVDTNYGIQQMNEIRKDLSILRSIYLQRVTQAQTISRQEMHITLWLMIIGTVVFTFFLWFAYRQIILDLRAKRLLTERLELESSHDSLTQLPNRRFFLDRLRYSLDLAKREGDKLALLYIDLDGFKPLNDVLGHAFGDQALVQVSKLFLGVKREGDVLSRLGGDEFAILAPHVNDESEITVFAQRLLDAFSDPDIQRLSVRLGASIGISFFPSDAHRVDDLLHAADEAMYRAKRSGGRQFQFYRTQLTEELTREQRLRNDLPSALEKGEIQVWYQPFVKASNQCITGAEALIRWQHPDFGLLLPGDFLPQAEKAGLLPRIAQEVIRVSIAELKTWITLNPDLTLSINLSAQDCLSPGVILSALETALIEHHISAHHVEIELTESSLIRPEADYVIHELHRFGVRLAIDDFGTGYASLEYLSRFPVQKIKIDRSFVKHLPDDPYHQKLVPAMVTMAHSLELDVTAEGIETFDQEQFLQEIQCDYLQGYRYGRPMPSTDFVKMIQTYLPKS